jgi:hypothetical protein
MYEKSGGSWLGPQHRKMFLAKNIFFGIWCVRKIILNTKLRECPYRSSQGPKLILMGS